MSNSYFKFKEFTVNQDRTAMKVCTDACLFGAWLVNTITRRNLPIADILDIGAGTGLLSLMLAQQTEATIEAIEIDKAAAQQARENFEASPWKERIKLIEGDVRTTKLSKNSDLIVSNPPFFENDLKSHKKERNIALHSDNLNFEDLINFILKNLKSQGFFAVLLPYHRTNSFIDGAEENNLFAIEQVLVKQTERHPFFRSMLLFSLVESEVKKFEITIKKNGEYSIEFVTLLKEYYLYL